MASPGQHMAGSRPADLPGRFLAGAFDRASTASLLLALACVLAGTGLSVAAPVILADIVDALASSQGSAAPLICAYAACLGLARLAGEGRTFLHGRAEQDIVRRLTGSAVARVFALPAVFFLRRSSGELLQTLENGLQGYRLFLQHGVFTLIPGLLEMLVIGGVLAVCLDGAFLLVFAACALLYGAVFFQAARSVLRASRQVSAARIETTSGLADSLLNIETIKALSGEATMTARLDSRLMKTRDAWRSFHAVRARSGVLIALIFTGGMMAVLLLSESRIRAGTMTPGEIVLAASYMMQIVRPMELLGFAARDLGQASAFARRLADILRETPEPGGGAVPAASAQGMEITFENVSCRSPEGAPVLSELTFSIPAGTKVGIVGPSGSGKSTLVRLLLRFLDPGDGCIRIDGKDISKLSPGLLRRQIAWIPQSPGLFNDSLAFNTGFPDTVISPDSLTDRLSSVGLAHLACRTSGAGERGAALSGGERQRIAIARAMKGTPRLILADEPTAALDAQTESGILNLLQTAGSNATLILVSHRLRAVRDMDLILVLRGGRIIESGTHADLLLIGGSYAALWQHQEREGPG